VASLDRQSDETGFWYSARARAAEVSAYRESDREGTPFTVFWHGRTRLRHMLELIKPPFLTEQFPSLNALIFARGRRVRIEDLRFPRIPLTWPFRSTLFPLHFYSGARFVRLECVAPNASAYSAGLMVWARLDLPKLLMLPPPNEIGVYMLPAVFPSVRDRLIDFIRKSQPTRASDDDIQDCLEALYESFSPKPDNHLTFA
jgi:hypothetical protein